MFSHCYFPILVHRSKLLQLKRLTGKDIQETELLLGVFVLFYSEDDSNHLISFPGAELGP